MWILGWTGAFRASFRFWVRGLHFWGIKYVYYYYYSTTKILYALYLLIRLELDAHIFTQSRCAFWGSPRFLGRWLCFVLFCFQTNQHNILVYTCTGTVFIWSFRCHLSIANVIYFLFSFSCSRYFKWSKQNFPLGNKTKEYETLISKYIEKFMNDEKHKSVVSFHSTLISSYI